MRRPTYLAILVMIVFGLVATYTASSEETRAKVDIAFVIDATGSMRNDIAAVKERVTQIVNSLEGVDARLALIVFRDWPCCDYGEPSDCPVNLLLNFTRDRSLFIEKVLNITVSRGGDPPEAQLSALWAALHLGWRPDAYKVIILMTDAPYHEPSPDDCVARHCIDAWSRCVPDLPQPPLNLNMSFIEKLAAEKRINVIYVLLPQRSLDLLDVYSAVGTVKLYTSPEEAAAIAEDIASSAAASAATIAQIRVIEATLSPSPNGSYTATVHLYNNGTLDAYTLVSVVLDGLTCSPSSQPIVIPTSSTTMVRFSCPKPSNTTAELSVYVNDTLIDTVTVTVPGVAPKERYPDIESLVESIETRLAELESKLGAMSNSIASLSRLVEASTVEWRNVAELHKQVEEALATLNTLQVEIRSLINNVTYFDLRISTLENRLQEMEDRVYELRATVERCYSSLSVIGSKLDRLVESQHTVRQFYGIDMQTALMGAIVALLALAAAAALIAAARRW